jgi:hypothetical protein
MICLKQKPLMTKKTIAFIPILFLIAFISDAQVTENFNDGDFTSNPTWIVSNSSDWAIDSAFQLQSNNMAANSTFYISTASTLATTAQWEFYVDLAFNTSSANYVDIYLTSSESDLTQNTTTGYFVRLGSTNDNISLYRKDGVAIQQLINGTMAVLNHSDNKLKIKIIRNASNQWILFRDTTGTGNNYFSEGSITDATYTTSSYFGIFVKQSTASFFQHHFFDDIVVQPYTPDITPPVIQSATATSANTLDVLFDEPLDHASSQIINNYTINKGIGFPVSASQDISNSALVHLAFTDGFINGNYNQLIINGVKDISGNVLTNGIKTFSYFAPYTAQQYDIVIDEIMSDPTPQVGLPDNEWIELKNTSASPINLQGWTIGDLTENSGAMPNFILQPDSFVIVCTGSAFTAMSAFGKAISVTSFPSLDNTGDQLALSTADGKIIHAVKYSDDWYQNELKKSGGWSLEMIDTKNPCSGFGNWIASVDPSGGTPGKKNSVDTNNIDQTPPHLLRAYTIDSINITLVFDEPLDSLKAATAGNYLISDGIGIPQSAVAVSPLFDKVNLRLATSLNQNKVYTVTSNSLTDCAGNTIGSANIARVGLSSVADSFDVIINEILFNPKPNGVDYVEIYNRGNKIINLKQIHIANRNSTGVISSITQLSTDDYLLFPQDFIVITENPGIVKSQYITLNPDAFITVGSMPSFSDANGDVILLNAQGNITDELQYDASWQFPLIDNPEGVALERIDYDAPTQSSNNWHSAATSTGYGTPTYKNSQYRIDQQLQGEINISPAIFSPDNDGVDDFATIDYNFPEPGYVANITIFDASGRPVRYLQQNALCGTKGKYQWDGLGDKNQKLPIGIYVVCTEIFNLDGKTKQFKNPIVLARRNT